MFTGQELFCMFLGYVLYRPTKDNWKSIKGVISTFLDCWTNGEKSTFVHHSPNHISVFIPTLNDRMERQTTKVFELIYFPGEEYELEIKWLEENEWESDKYKINWFQ